MVFLKKHKLFIIPILVMIIIAPLTPYIDMQVANYFHLHKVGDVLSTKYRGFSSNSFFDFIYEYGLLPAQVTFVAVVIYAARTWKKREQAIYNRVAIVLALSFFVGAGVITHFMLKDHWGRPRPKQVIEFGGSQKFKPFYSPNIQINKTKECELHNNIKSIPIGCNYYLNFFSNLKSFPSGHATTGFYFLTLYFIGIRLGNRRLKIAGLTIGLLLGILLSVGRIVQGGHFFSDILMAALIMWESAYFADLYVFEKSRILRIEEQNSTA